MTLPTYRDWDLLAVLLRVFGALVVLVVSVANLVAVFNIGRVALILVLRLILSYVMRGTLRRTKRETPDQLQGLEHNLAHIIV